MLTTLALKLTLVGSALSMNTMMQAMGDPGNFRSRMNHFDPQRQFMALLSSPATSLYLAIFMFLFAARVYLVVLYPREGPHRLAFYEAFTLAAVAHATFVLSVGLLGIVVAMMLAVILGLMG